MNQCRLAIHADIGPHTEVPLVALRGLMHLRIPLLGPILRRPRRTEDGRIHDGASAHPQPLFRQIFPDPCKERLAQLVGFQAMPKLADGHPIGYGLAAQINPHQLPHGARVVLRLFHVRIRQVELLLQTMQAHHGSIPIGGRLGPSAVGYTGLITGVKSVHWDDSVPFLQKPLAAGGLAILFEGNPANVCCCMGCASSEVRWPRRKSTLRRDTARL